MQQWSRRRWSARCSWRRGRWRGRSGQRRRRRGARVRESMGPAAATAADRRTLQSCWRASRALLRQCTLGLGMQCQAAHCLRDSLSRRQHAHSQLKQQPARSGAAAYCSRGAGIFQSPVFCGEAVADAHMADAQVSMHEADWDAAESKLTKVCPMACGALLPPFYLSVLPPRFALLGCRLGLKKWSLLSSCALGRSARWRCNQRQIPQPALAESPSHTLPPSSLSSFTAPHPLTRRHLNSIA